MVMDHFDSKIGFRPTIFWIPFREGIILYQDGVDISEPILSFDLTHAVLIKPLPQKNGDLTFKVQRASDCPSLFFSSRLKWPASQVGIFDMGKEDFIETCKKALGGPAALPKGLDRFKGGQ